MPRSFLVKKVKLDTFSSADLDSSYGRARSDLGVRLQDKGALWTAAGAGPRALQEGVGGQSVGVEWQGRRGCRSNGSRLRLEQRMKAEGRVAESKARQLPR